VGDAFASVRGRKDDVTVERWDLLSIDAPQGTRDPVVLYQDDGARAVLIVLRPGQQLGEHQVKENAWVTVVDGSVRVTAGDESFDAQRGALVRFRPDERHSLVSDDGARLLLVLAPWPGAGHYRGDRDGV
jgi:quercetin dioxygenase-like cupin family protein